MPKYQARNQVVPARSGGSSRSHVRAIAGTSTGGAAPCRRRADNPRRRPRSSSCALTDNPLTDRGLLAANDAPAQLGTSVHPFLKRHSTATVVYKRRRPLEPDSGKPRASANDTGDPGLQAVPRAPRVVRVAALADPSTDPVAAPSLAQPAGTELGPPAANEPQPVPRRRRRRDALRAPGEVRHIVFERADVGAPTAVHPDMGTGPGWAPGYPLLRQSLDTLAQTLQQVQRLQRWSADFAALLARRGR